MGVGRWMTPKLRVFSEGVGISWYLSPICDKCCHADRANWRIWLISSSKPYLENVKHRIHEKTLLAAFSFPEQSGVSVLDPGAVTLGIFWNTYSLLPFNSVYLTEEEIGRKDIGFLTLTAKIWNDLMGEKQQPPFHQLSVDADHVVHESKEDLQ